MEDHDNISISSFDDMDHYIKSYSPFCRLIMSFHTSLLFVEITWQFFGVDSDLLYGQYLLLVGIKGEVLEVLESAPLTDQLHSTLEVFFVALDVFC